MAKIGVEISIDVTKIDRSRIFEGKKGKYLTLTGFIDTNEQDQYGNNGFITQKKDKDEPKDMKMPILGNSKVFWSGQQPAPQAAPQQVMAAPQSIGFDDIDDDIPF